VVGREFTLPVLQEVAGQDEDKLLDVIDKAVASRVLTPRPSLGQESYAFADQQARDVLYEGIGPARRRRYHLRVGQAIEKVHSRRLEEHYDALAHHFVEGNDLEKAAEYAIEAGRRAYSLSSWERAIDHFETALELLGELPEDLPRQARVLERLVVVDILLGRQMLRHSQAALELYTRLGDKRRAARMHHQVAGAWASGMAGQEDMEKAFPHYQAGVKLLEAEPDSAEKAFCYGGLAHGLYRMLDLEGALQQGRQALQIAERLNDLNQVGQACTDLALVLASRGDLAQAEEYAERSWQVAHRPWFKARASAYPIMIWPWRNDRAWLERWLERCLEHRRRSYVERYDVIMHRLAGLLSALTGSPQKAAEALRRAEEAASGRPYLDPGLAFSAGAAYAVLGEWEQAKRFLVGALEAAESGHEPHYSVEACMYYGRFLLASGDTAKAEEVLSKGYTLAHQKGSVLQELNLLPLLCELHVKTGDLEQAGEDLKRAQEILARPEPWRGLAAPVYLAEGMLATTRGSWPEADKAFGEALEVERTHGFLYHEARVMVAWGEMHLKRDAPGDRERGMELLDQALAIFQRCAAKKDVEKVLGKKGRLGA
jgi:tetratricopeptide (TPR) repeat protein